MSLGHYVLILLFVCVPAALLIAICQDAGMQRARAQAMPEDHWTYIGDNTYQRQMSVVPWVMCYQHFEQMECVSR